MRSGVRVRDRVLLRLGPETPASIAGPAAQGGPDLPADATLPDPAASRPGGRAPWRRGIRAWRSLLVPHLPACAIILIAAAIGQAAMFIQKPLIYYGPDTSSYTDVVRATLISKWNLMDPLRTPAYPALLTLLYTLRGFGSDIFVVHAQAALLIISALECYALAYCIARRRWIACAIASLIAVNIYFLSWERILYTEALSYWSVITLLLCFERLVRRPSSYGWAAAFGVCSFLSIMVRPANELLPVALLGVLLLRALRLRGMGRVWKQAILSLAACYLLVFGYAIANHARNGVFTLTYASNMNLFGKVEEYHMVGLSVDQRYASIQADAQTFAAEHPDWSVPDPWTFGDEYARRGYAASYYAPMGAYGENLILRHPTEYVLGSLGDVVETWRIRPMLYAMYNVAPDGSWTADPSITSGLQGYNIFYHGFTSTRYEPVWVNALLVLSTAEYWAYLLLPILLVGALVWCWKRPRQTSAFLVLVLLVAVTCMILMAAFGTYDEFYRVRFPVDGAMFIAAGIVILSAAERVAVRLRHR